MPKTKTEAIAAALLDAVDHGTGIEEALARHQKSKGPLYLALASVLNTLRTRVNATILELKAAEIQHKALADDVAALNARRRAADVALAQMADETERQVVRRAAIDKEIVAAEALGAKGFGVEELGRLAELLAVVAAKQGAPPEEGVRQFFETMGRYEKVTALDLEVRRAEARAATARAECERCEAELRRAETRSRARMETIAGTERLLSQGIRPDDLLRWEKVLAIAQMSVIRFGAALKRFGSLAAMARAERAQVEQLRRDATRLRRQVDALQRERAGIVAEVAAVRDAGITAVKRVASDVQHRLDEVWQAVEEFGVVRTEAGRLEGHLALVRMLQLDGESHTQPWTEAPLWLVWRMLKGLIAWAQACAGDELSPPDALARRHYWLRYNKLRAVDLLLWFSGAVSRALEAEAERVSPR